MHIRQDEWTQNEANMVYLWYIIYTHTPIQTCIGHSTMAFKELFY